SITIQSGALGTSNVASGTSLANGMCGIGLAGDLPGAVSDTAGGGFDFCANTANPTANPNKAVLRNNSLSWYFQGPAIYLRDAVLSVYNGRFEGYGGKLKGLAGTVVCVAGLVLLTAGLCPAAEEDGAFFESKVRPVLAAQCYSCHTSSALGGLRVDSKQALLKGGKSGAAIVPGDPDKSLLIAAVRQSGALKMPMGGKLDSKQVDDLVAW